MLVSGGPVQNRPPAPFPSALQKKVSIDIDARLGITESQFMLNKSNPSLLRTDMSENKDMIHIVLHVTKTFAKKEVEFWKRTELHHPEILSEHLSHSWNAAQSWSCCRSYWLSLKNGSLCSSGNIDSLGMALPLQHYTALEMDYPIEIVSQ